jgi:excisionase family DNA binding protein
MTTKTPLFLTPRELRDMNGRHVTTLTLQQAATLLHMSAEALRRKVRAGVIPGAKPGRRWVFVEADLLAYLRTLYASPRHATQGHNARVSSWPYTNVAASGGSVGPTQTDAEYNEALGLGKNRRRRSLKLNGRPKSGELPN